MSALPRRAFLAAVAVAAMSGCADSGRNQAEQQVSTFIHEARREMQAIELMLGSQQDKEVTALLRRNALSHGQEHFVASAIDAYRAQIFKIDKNHPHKFFSHGFAFDARAHLATMMNARMFSVRAKSGNPNTLKALKQQLPTEWKTSQQQDGSVEIKIPYPINAEIRALITLSLNPSILSITPATEGTSVPHSGDRPQYLLSSNR